MCVTVSQNMFHVVLYMLAHLILTQRWTHTCCNFVNGHVKNEREVVNDTVPQQSKPIPGIRVETLRCRILGNGAW